MNAERQFEQSNPLTGYRLAIAASRGIHTVGGFSIQPMKTKAESNYTTAILKCPSGAFVVVGATPRSCMTEDCSRQKVFATEQQALEAILADPWIQETDQPIQMADCSFYRTRQQAQAA